MKLRDCGPATWAAAVSLGLIFGIAACGQDNTIDYLYVANAKNNPGQINVYLVDSLSGTLRQIKESPYPTGGRNPQSIVTTPNGKYLYVVNHDDNTIVEFAIGTDAKIYPGNTYQTPGSDPTALAIDSAGAYLFVTDAFQPGGTPSQPGPGALVIYPINTDGTLGNPLSYRSGGVSTSYLPTCNNPVAVAVSASAVYVVNDPAGQPPKIANTVESSATGANGTNSIDYSGSTANGCSATFGQITAYTLNAGSPAAIAGSPFTVAGTVNSSQPVAVASFGNFLYVTDLANDSVLAYGLSAQPAVGVPTALGAFATGVGPNALTIDPANSYLYVANFTDNSIGAYRIAANGTLGQLSTSGFVTGTNPAAILIEPSAGQYLYAANFLGNTVTGTHLTATTGALNGVEESPFAANGQPTSMAAVVHGKPLAGN